VLPLHIIKGITGKNRITYLNDLVGKTCNSKKYCKNCKVKHTMASEIVTKNETGITDEDAVRCDWIELYNGGQEMVSLEGWFLSDKPEEPDRWRFPAVSIAPGEYLLVYASGKDRISPLHTSFSLSVGETVTLSTPVGTQAAAVECPVLEADEALALQPDGSYAIKAMPTPGSANE
jgi:hypothetical protein